MAKNKKINNKLNKKLYIHYLLEFKKRLVIFKYIFNMVYYKKLLSNYKRNFNKLQFIKLKKIICNLLFYNFMFHIFYKIGGIH